MNGGSRLLRESCADRERLGPAKRDLLYVQSRPFPSRRACGETGQGRKHCGNADSHIISRKLSFATFPGQATRPGETRRDHLVRPKSSTSQLCQNPSHRARAKFSRPLRPTTCPHGTRNARQHPTPSAGPSCAYTFFALHPLTKRHKKAHNIHRPRVAIGAQWNVR